MRKLLLRTSLAGGVLLASSPASQAAEVTRIASSFEEPDRFDIHFGVEYDYQFKQAAILREWNSGEAGDTETRLVKDLIFRHQRQTLTPQVEVGLWHDLSLYLALPIVVWDTRTYGFDRRADDCVYGRDVPPSPQATCVDKSNSTTLRDEILPVGGIDARAGDPFGTFTDPRVAQIFRGPIRNGLDQLHIGIKYGILNQRKRSHMPDWVIAAEGRFAVGRAMSFSRDFESDPAGNRRVGRRIHELGLWTTLSRRYRFLDPFFGAHWRQSIRAAGSKFQDFSDLGAQGTVGPMSEAGVRIGTEIIPYEKKARHLEVAIYVSGSATLHYGGRGYSEIWELLADSPALVGAYDPAAQRPAEPGFCDRDEALAFARANPGDPGYLAAGGGSCQRFEGITNIQDYASFGFDGGLNLQLGKYTEVLLGVKVNADTTHFVTAAPRGDADREDGGGTDPERVERGTREVNPLRRDVVDNVGRRYAVGDVVSVFPHLRVLITF